MEHCLKRQSAKAWSGNDSSGEQRKNPLRVAAHCRRFEHTCTSPNLNFRSKLSVAGSGPETRNTLSNNSLTWVQHHGWQNFAIAFAADATLQIVVNPEQILQEKGDCG